MYTKKFNLKNALDSSRRTVSAVIGFDGFVDKVLHVVDQRSDTDTFKRIPTISAYADRIASGSGMSCNFEVVPVQKKAGGNGPLLARALCGYGFDLTYIGCLGSPAIDQAFDELTELCEKVYSISDPGYDSTYEFYDGKIMMLEIEPFKKMSWEALISAIGFDEFVNIVDHASLIGMENWTLLPHMSNIWEHFLSEVTPRLSEPLSQKVCFFDLADPESRENDDIKKAVTLINRFAEVGFRVVLGLNKREACELAELYGYPIDSYPEYPLPLLLKQLSRHLHIECIVIHPVDRACCYCNGRVYEEEGFYCENPKLTTGAGDTFNSGFLLGYMNDFTPEQCLLCGVAASGFYVRNAKAPSPDELSDFIAAHREF